jgi:predicted phage baseplate assembly protein
VYTTRIADDRTLTVQFGDGVTGARLPSGRQNVVARYRQGIGVDGDVAAARITTLLDRPPGLRGASNPIAADGGAEPESLARARETAPGTVRTFGRAVSLRDFEDATLTAGIVAKATATWVWTGERRAIHLTVAAEGGKTLSDTTIALVGQMFAAGRDTNHTLLIANYAPVAILVDATITVDDRHVADTVLAAARTALLDTLSFDARSFAQPVYLSDIFSVLQEVDGVLFVDVNILDLKSRDAAFRAARGVDDTPGQPQPHLLMLPARPDAATGTVLPAELAIVEAPADVTLSANGGISP